MLSCLKVKYSDSERHKTVEYGSSTAEQDTTMKSHTTSLCNVKVTTPELFHCIKSVAEKSCSHRFLCWGKTHWRYFSNNPHFSSSASSPSLPFCTNYYNPVFVSRLFSYGKGKKGGLGTKLMTLWLINKNHKEKMFC